MRFASPAVAVFLLATSAFAGVLPITSYNSFADSPFSGTAFQYFHLENFESGGIFTPGASASGGAVLGPGPLADSVDADAGGIDGSGTDGRSWYSNGSNAVRFTFSQAILGVLPTHAGIVWTDVGFTNTGLGTGVAELEAFDALGVSLGVITSGVLGDGLPNGGTAEDRFFGFTNAGGISAIELRMPESTDWEMDHLQYGSSAVPEPSTLAFGAIGLGAAAAARLRKR